MIIDINCEEIQQLLKLTKGDVSIAAKDKIYLIAEIDPKELNGNRVMIVLDGEITKPGQTIINRKVLNNIPKVGLVQIIENTIKCGTRSIEFKENYEALSVVDVGEKFITIPNDEFKKVLEIEYAAAKDETRPILKGICLDQENFVALDGYRLAIRKHSIISKLDKYYVVIPTELISIYKKIKSNEDIDLHVNDRFVTLEVGNIQVSVDVLLGEYINYQTLLPTDHRTEVITDSKELLDLLKSYKDIDLVKLEFKNDEIQVKASNELMSIEDILKCEMKGEPLEIAFNIKYLIDSLKQYEDDVIFELRDSLSPMVITDDEGKTDLVLPVRIKQN